MAPDTLLCCCYTGLDVFAAVGRFNDEDYSPDSFRQLQPVLPQRPVDVQADIAYFVNDVSADYSAVLPLMHTVHVVGV